MKPEIVANAVLIVRRLIGGGLWFLVGGGWACGLEDVARLPSVPERADRLLSYREHDLALVDESVFLMCLNDPAAALGVGVWSLSVDSPSMKAASEAYSLQWMDQDLGIARIFLPAMDLDLLPMLDQELAQLRSQAPLHTLVLDLRGAGGGDVRTLNGLLARFLPQGTLAYTLHYPQGEDAEVRVEAHTAAPEDQGVRLLVLTSGKTRGGAELLAGALQANGRALVVGEPTAGMAGHKRVAKLAEHRYVIFTWALPRFPGQMAPATQIMPDIAAPAGDALTVALERLADHGRLPANPFIRPDEKRHPLVQAVLDGDEEEALSWIDNGADLAVEASKDGLEEHMRRHMRASYKGVTPVVGYPLAIAAAVRRMPRVLAAIGQHEPALLERTDSQGRTALAYGAMAGQPDIVRVLLEYGLSPLHPGQDFPISHTPLALAVELMHANVVKQLMAAVPRQQLNHLTVVEAVWVATFGNDLATLKVLLEAGTSPNYIAPQGGTALIEAVRYRNLEAVRLLLQSGAVIDNHLYRGKSVIQYAEDIAKNSSSEELAILKLIRGAPRARRD